MTNMFEVAKYSLSLLYILHKNQKVIDVYSILPQTQLGEATRLRMHRCSFRELHS